MNLYNKKIKNIIKTKQQFRDKHILTNAYFWNVDSLKVGMYIT